MYHTMRARIAQAAAGAAAAAILFGSWAGAARAAITTEPVVTFENGPEVIGTLIIPAREVPGAGREDVRRIDNERRVSLKLARQEAAKGETKATEIEEETEPERVYLGRYKVTGYDTCSRCCGNSNGVTASGEIATVGRTCAAGRELPFGTRIWIDGLGERVVEDRGGAVNGGHIDVLCADHPECYSITGYYDIWKVVG